MLPLATPGEQLLAAILKHDAKTTSYKLALVRALGDLALSAPVIPAPTQDVAVPLRWLAELWVAYYWPFVDPARPIYQGARAARADGPARNDLSFRPALTRLRQTWQDLLAPLSAVQPADGYFLLAEMRTPRRRAGYPPVLTQAYDAALAAILPALAMPIRYAGPGQWAVFARPTRAAALPPDVTRLPGTMAQEACLVVPAALWQALGRLSLYVEALSVHEWSLFTEQVRQPAGQTCTRGEAYTLLTARPDSRRPLNWERNQVDVLLLEQVSFTCPWTRKPLTQPGHYDLDHLLPLSLYPINELWNLVPVDRHFNQRVKRDRVPASPRLLAAEPLLAATYATYQRSVPLARAVREDAGLRFGPLPSSGGFAGALARQTVQFVEGVAGARLVSRF